MKFDSVAIKSGVAIALASVGSTVFAAADYSAITGAVSAGDIVTAIGAIAAIIVLPKVAVWGFHKVMGMIPGR